MENQQPKWPIFSKAESVIVGVVLVTVFSMAFIANLSKSNVLSSVLNEPNPYASLSCNKLVDKMSQSDALAIDEFESRCLTSEAGK
jgi:hypothetical protein